MNTYELTDFHKEFLAQKEALKIEGINVLRSLKGEEVSESNLGDFLYSTDPQVITRDSHPLLQDILDDGEPELKEEVRHKRYTTLLWLASGGYLTILKTYSIGQIVWLKNFYNDFWDLYIHETLEEKDHPFFLPPLSFWSLYLTIRGPVPDDFPEDGIFAYAIFRIVRMMEDLHWKGFKTTPFEAKALQQLEKKLKELKTEAETYLAREAGTYDELKAERQVKKGSIPKAHLPWLKEMKKRHDRGVPLDQIIRDLQEGGNNK